MTKVTTREYLNGECIGETVQQFDGDELVSETITEYEPSTNKKYTKQSPESIAKMLASRAAKKAKAQAAQ